MTKSNHQSDAALRAVRFSAMSHRDIANRLFNMDIKDPDVAAAINSAANRLWDVPSEVADQWVADRAAAHADRLAARADRLAGQ